MRRLALVVSLAAVMACLAFGLARAASDNERAAVAAAKAWLKIIDDGRYPESWKVASGYFQGAVSEEQWERSLEGVRRPIGGPVSRKIQTAKEATQLPGAPDGDYVVMRFKTSFRNKKSAVETVTFVLEKDGVWKAAGYFIK